MLAPSDQTLALHDRHAELCTLLQESDACCMQGALALLDVETGVESVSEVEAGAAFLIMLFLTSAEPKRA
jgi:hypothetical protein